MATKLISFSLYGTSPLYHQGAVRNARLAPHVYPGWKTRFYVSEEVPETIIDALLNEGAEIVRKERRGQIDGMFWRFLPIADASLEAVVVRDVDSRLTPREYQAVQEWMASGKTLHLMRDHPCHRVVIMAGMWGCRGGAVPDMQDLVDSWSLWHKKGHDQDFLRDQVYPRFKHSILVHSDLYAYRGEECRPFPAPRPRGEFVGCVIDGDRDTPTETQAAKTEEAFKGCTFQQLSPAKRRRRWTVQVEHWFRVCTGRTAAA